MALRGHLGPCWAQLGPILGIFGRSWGHLGPILGHVGPNLGPSWASWGALWAILGLSWAMLGLSSGIFRSLKANRSCARMPRVCFRASSWNHSFCGHYPRRRSLTRPGGMREAIESGGGLQPARCVRFPEASCFRLLSGELRRLRAFRQTSTRPPPGRMSPSFFFRSQFLAVCSLLLKVALTLMRIPHFCLLVGLLPA